MPKKWMTAKEARTYVRRYDYYKTKHGLSGEACAILAVEPQYVRTEFRKVKKLHGVKHAEKWLKAKYGGKK